MKYILTITLALFISSNVIADEQQYIDEAKKQADTVYVAKIILSNGKPGYHLWSEPFILGSQEAKAGQLCKAKGYAIIREETIGQKFRRWVIQCNE